MRRRYLLPLMQRSKRLLHMRYKPSELAEELGCSSDVIYHHLIPSGLPVERDNQDHIWIVGTTCCEWLQAVVSQDQKVGKLKDGEYYCLCCRKAMPGVPTGNTRPNGRWTELVEAHCTGCGSLVFRARRSS